MMLALAPVACTASRTVLKTGSPCDRLAALAGRDAADDVGAVVHHLPGVELAFAAR